MDVVAAVLSKRYWENCEIIRATEDFDVIKSLVNENQQLLYALEILKLRLIEA